MASRASVRTAARIAVQSRDDGQLILEGGKRRERRGHRTNSTRCGDSDGRGSGWLVLNRKCTVATQTLTAPSTWTDTRTTGTLQVPERR